jgi:glycerate-2-kinase
MNREIAERIFLAGIKAVLPRKVIDDLISIRGSLLKIGYLSFDLDQITNIYIVGAGISSAAMGHYIENILEERIRGGCIVTAYGHFCRLNKVEVIEAAGSVPDLKSFVAADKIRQIATGASENDLVICLWSGGGSSLMADYPAVSSPQDVIYLYELLGKSGADLREIDVIRKHLSGIKGGYLAKHIWPAKSVSILLSDIPGDPPEIIASGPTIPDDSTYADAIKILENNNLISEAPIRLVNFLFEGKQGKWPETPKRGDPVFGNSAFIVSGSNKSALQASRNEAERIGLNTFIISPELKGDVSNACSFLIETIASYKNNSEIRKPLCLLFGGRTTIRVTTDGRGGRNQHLALSAAVRLKELPGVTLLAADTDGNDGNTGMAGAVVDSGTINRALSRNIDPESFLYGFDSFNFFRATGDHIFTDRTMTDVMDIVIAILD